MASIVAAWRPDLADASAPETDPDLEAFAPFVTNEQLGGLLPTFMRTGRVQGGTPSHPTPEMVWTFQPRDSSKAPFAWLVGGASFNGRWNPVVYQGYNCGGSKGGRANLSEPLARVVIETDYDDGNSRAVEIYSEFESANGAVRLRPYFFKIDRNATHHAEAVQAASILGNPFSICVPHESAATGLAVARFVKGAMQLTGHDDHSTVLMLSAGAGQRGELMIGRDENPAHVTFTAARETPEQFGVTVNGVSVLHLYSAPAGAHGGSALAVGANDNSAAGVFAVGSSSPAVKALVARGRIEQTANIFEVQDADMKPVMGATASGHFFTSNTSEPADDELGAGQLALWFDATNGAAKLMVKARQENGAIRKRALSLS